MLIDFTVENRRSIKDPVTLSAIAAKRRRASGGSRRFHIKPDDEIAPPYKPEGWDFELLPVLALFGPNASGKSNVINAFHNLLELVCVSEESKADSWAKMIPFLLDDGHRNMPIRYELRVLAAGKLYTYSLHLNRERILLEQLHYALPASKRNRLLFARTWDEGQDGYRWKYGRDLASSSIKPVDDIKHKEPHLGNFVHAEVEITDPFEKWLFMRPPGVGLGYEDTDTKIAALRALSENDHREKVARLVRLFDVGIVRIQVQTKDGDWEGPDGRLNIFCFHHANNKGYILPLQEESTGTQRLFGLASRLVFTLECGGLLLVDELGSNIHPNVSRVIIKLFQDPKTNPKRAQLIFTSHDNTLLRDNLLRRDQIWFTEKRPDGSTDLYPLSDFKVRNDLALDRGYLDGRFGAVPILPSEEILQPFEEILR